MAIYHFNVSAVKRSEGRSVVAAAAWQRGIDLPDDRLGRTHKFAKRGPGTRSNVLLPQGGDVSWLDPGVLWNAIEARETRRDAQLARRFQLSLPNDLSTQQNLDLCRSFVGRVLVDDGMVADVTVRLTKEDGSANPFAVILTTMRSLIVADGLPRFGNKVRLWDDRRTLARWRQEWCDDLNAALKSAGHAARVDHRPMAVRAPSLEPQITVGVVAKRRHKRGLYSERVVENDAIRSRRRNKVEAVDRVGDLTEQPPSE